MKSTIFICQLSTTKQNKLKKLIEKYLVKEGYEEKSKEILNNCLDDRLINLEEIIDITEFL